MAEKIVDEFCGSAVERDLPRAELDTVLFGLGIVVNLDGVELCLPQTCVGLRGEGWNPDWLGRLTSR